VYFQNFKISKNLPHAMKHLRLVEIINVVSFLGEKRKILQSAISKFMQNCPQGKKIFKIGKNWQFFKTPKYSRYF